ncbi:HNH endonuclease [Rhizobium leguminosarum]|uniref:HNH endonuclease n=1 Tax=Rhizobium leguminosarum TaxID=384 RepID=UPI001C939DAE|nr:HNH endonuclease [Rhizobium leguminosarum]MBY5775975.1 HNH endonuclease [Rhizobium leguminosarum]
MELLEYDLDKPTVTRLPSPGICIYCMEETKGLTDEHVIPYALAANMLILEKSCCEACQGIITSYEQDVLRHQLGIFRIQVDAPSRTRKRDRPTHADIEFIEVDATGRKLRDLPTKSIAIKDLPLIFALWQSPPPTILKEQVQMPSKAWSFIEKEGAMRLCREVAEETGAVHVAMRAADVRKYNYLRSLAKTAHAVAVARFGVDAFEPYLRDIILKRSGDLERYVGDVPGQSPFEEHPAHTMHISIGGVEGGPAEGSLVVRIQLYPSLKSPEHMIVVGMPKRNLDPEAESQEAHT